jgi:hypothetical protein
VCKARGLKSFCNQIDLLSQHPQGRDALEKVFFGDVDSNGAKARDILVQSGPNSLTNEQRSDFARLLMSLEARRPAVVGTLREGGGEFAKKLNEDASIVAALRKAGVQDSPAQFFEKRSGRKLEDRSLAVIQRLVDNPVVGSRLVKANWAVEHLGCPSLILSDRPFTVADAICVRRSGVLYCPRIPRRRHERRRGNRRPRHRIRVAIRVSEWRWCRRGRHRNRCASSRGVHGFDGG